VGVLGEGVDHRFNKREPKSNIDPVRDETNLEQLRHRPQSLKEILKMVTGRSLASDFAPETEPFNIH
jgi:hypothetical protein